MMVDAIEKSDLKLAGVFDNIVQDARIDSINVVSGLIPETGC